MFMCNYAKIADVFKRGIFKIEVKTEFQFLPKSFTTSTRRVLKLYCTAQLF